MVVLPTQKESPTRRGHSPSCSLGIVRKSIDRKSTRLNSSHLAISYAVFCLKKKTPHALPDAVGSSLGGVGGVEGRSCCSLPRLAARDGPSLRALHAPAACAGARDRPSHARH